jgi:hypothetical protein
LTPLGSVESIFFGNPLFTIETMVLSLALRLHELKKEAADSAVCISKLMVAIANPAS